MGNYPSVSANSVGVFQFGICACCPGGGQFNAVNTCCCMPCCKPLRPPSGPEWDKVDQGEWAIMIAEAAQIANSTPKGCGCCLDVFKIKAELDAQWLSKANGFLDGSGLYCEVLAFYTSDGKSSTPHLWIQIFKKA